MHLLAAPIHILEHLVSLRMRRQGQGERAAGISWQRMRQVAVNLGCCAIEVGK